MDLPVQEWLDGGERGVKERGERHPVGEARLLQVGAELFARAALHRLSKSNHILHARAHVDGGETVSDHAVRGVEAMEVELRLR